MGVPGLMNDLYVFNPPVLFTRYQVFSYGGFLKVMGVPPFTIIHMGFSNIFHEPNHPLLARLAPAPAQGTIAGSRKGLLGAPRPSLQPGGSWWHEISPASPASLDWLKETFAGNLSN